MSSFSVTPRTGSNPATSGTPKRNVQFQWNGVNVGRRNTDTVNFEDLSAGLQVTIGVGEHVNVLTVGEDAE
jgi:hypothetical protein